MGLIKSQVVRTKVAIKSAELNAYRGGSGYVVAPGRVLTAAHATKPHDEVPAAEGQMCQPLGAGWLPGKVVWTDPDMDLAIIKVEGLPDRAHEFSPKVRIGLHCGDATRKGGDYEGAQVHLAARIGAIAEGDEILLSLTSCTESVRRDEISDPRLARLKGLAEPVEIVSLSWR